MNNRKEKNLLLLIGLPAIGKSTFVKNNGGVEENFIINRDDIVNEIANDHNLIYEELFKFPEPHEEEGHIHPKYGKVIKNDLSIIWSEYSYEMIYHLNVEIEKRYEDRIRQSLFQDKNVVIDEVLLDSASRKDISTVMKKYISEEEFNNMFHVHAIWFEHKDLSLVKELCNLRAEEAKLNGENKFIPERVFDSMMESFEEPKEEEGFHKITNVDRSKALVEIIAYKKKLLKKEEPKEPKKKKSSNRLLK